MLELIQEILATVVGVKATGKIRKADYKNVLWPALKALHDRNKKVSLLLQLETPLKNYSLGAWVADAHTGLKYFRHWRKVAIVSSSNGIRRFTNVVGKLAPGQYKGFYLQELEKAKEWAGA